MIRRLCREDEIPVELLDRRVRMNEAVPPLEKTLIGPNETITLRKEQITAGRFLIEKERGIIEIPGAVGKTELTIAAIKSVVNLGDVLIVVHTNEIREEWAKRLVTRGVDPALVGTIDGERYDINRITISNVQLLAARIWDRRLTDYLSQVYCVVVDECHKGGADTYQRVFNQLTNALYRWGLSATPLEYDRARNWRLIGMLGPLRYRLDQEEPTEEGSIARVIYHAISVPRVVYGTLPSLVTWQDYYDYYLHKSPFMHCLIRNCTRAYPQLQRLVLINNIEQGRAICRGLSGSKFVHGGTSEAVRDHRFRDFQQGRYSILVSSSILESGINVPEIRQITLGGGLESPIKFVQSIARGQRKKSGGENVVHIHDFMFDVPYLKEHSEKRFNMIRERFHKAEICHTI